MDACKNLTFLNIEGNTLGCEAAKRIGEALKNHPEFKRALWKDLFTGRMKTEIPIALTDLSQGMMFAKAQLTVLDLSDNALGELNDSFILSSMFTDTLKHNVQVPTA